MVNVLEIFVLFLAVCSVTCLSVEPQIVAIDEIEIKSAIDDSIRDLLDNLRYSLRCGFPEQNIPPLAPLYIKSAELDERGLLYNVRGNVRNFTLSGLDGYTVDVATLNVLTLRASVGLTFPTLSLSSFYGVDALLLRFLPIFGHGSLAFDVNDLSILANGRITLNIRTGRLNLTSLDIDVNMGSVLSDSTGVYDSRIVSTFFNVGLERIVRNIFDNNKDNLETALENLLIPLANGYLNELTLQDLLGLIGGSDDDESPGGPHLDPETGELVCNVEGESQTTEYVPSAETTSTIVDPTSPEEETKKSDETTTESTTLQPITPDGVSNSSNFLFNKFQVIIYTIASITSLMSL